MLAVSLRWPSWVQQDSRAALAMCEVSLFKSADYSGFGKTFYRKNEQLFQNFALSMSPSETLVNISIIIPSIILF